MADAAAASAAAAVEAGGKDGAREALWTSYIISGRRLSLILLLDFPWILEIFITKPLLRFVPK